ncbi:MAG: glycosyltransferase family 4 protein [Armatimonadota bacterium]
MRIAQFTESYRPVINGAAVAVRLLSEELSRRHEVRVFAPRYPGFADDEAVLRFPSYRVPHQRDYPLAIPYSRRLHRAFAGSGFEVVHTHSPFALGQTGLRWARRHGVPVVTTYHTIYESYAHYAPYFPKAWVASFLRRLSRLYCDRCDVVAAPTAPIRDLLLEYGVRTPIHVVPTGLRLLPPAPPDPAFPRGRYGIPPDAPLALYAGRLAREKNLELLFAGFARVARELPVAWLLVCGSGPVEAETRRLAAATGAAERIVFTGFIPPEQMPPVYAAADVFAFSSLTDTQGLVLTEAKAAGLPAVAVDAYGPGQVVAHGEDGLLTAPDVEAWSDALLHVLRDPAVRSQMRKRALERARDFTIEATAARYEELYAEARERAGRRKRD